MKEGSISRNNRLRDDGDGAGVLLELHWFARLVEARSFTVAAHSFGLSKSAMSRRLQQLERRLGVQLLHRSNRVFALTSIGEDVYQHALQMRAAAEAASRSAQLAQGSASGFVRLAAPAILHGWLVRILKEFLASHPRIRVALLDLGPGHDPITQVTDISLSLTAPPHDSSMLVVRSLATLPTQFLAAPALAEQLNRAPRQSNHALPLLCPSHGQAPFATDSLLALREAAISGMGIACLPTIACTEALHYGSLHPVSTSEQPADLPLLAITPSSRAITYASRLLMQAIQNSLHPA